MASTKVAAIPIWILFTVPAAAVAAMACLIAFGSNPAVAQVAGVVGLFSVTAAFVVVPVAIYALVADRESRSIPQLVGTTLCALPVLAMIGSLLFGGI